MEYIVTIQIDILNYELNYSLNKTKFLNIEFQIENIVQIWYHKCTEVES